MNRLLRAVPALVAITWLSLSQPGRSSEPAQDVVQSREAFAPLQFIYLCVRPCDCGKPLCGIICRPPALTCRDDYCPKPPPRISLCWPISRCDDYCPKPLPCWPPDPCACKPVQAFPSAATRASRQQFTAKAIGNADATH
ncbi:MAG TPA: hypothetical protein VJ809_10380 [Pirellulales bacterium]|jgi:hypothetical protein|nr:hypothetical protein [Pirellulales bacterium]